MRPVYFHVDLDAFYASVEKVEHPELKDKPVIVGGLPPRRGVVSACSYEARRYGIRSGMPIQEAMRRCPHGIFLPVRMRLYQEYSRRVMEILHRFTPEVRQISVDEASLDMSGTERLFGPPEEAARTIQRTIREEVGVTASIGIASNRYVAKLASERNKPAGLFLVPRGEEEPFIRSLDLADLWGVGEKTLALLKQKGITTTSRLQALTREQLQALFGKAQGAFLHTIAHGHDPGIYHDEPKTRSASHEETFDQDITTMDQAETHLLALSHKVMERLLLHEETGKTVFIKIRYSSFTTTTAQITLPTPIQCAEDLYETARTLLTSRWDGKTPIRLLGVGVSGLAPETELLPPQLFPDPSRKKKTLEEALLALEKKKGRKLLTKARLLPHPHRDPPAP
ncbi:DNA polymerase IV [Spirochaeta thermophila]|uniref:DNA polymerase IV n=1 Tax=Winmispira thermophila (strain ATCC 49972 / DSM 6192 / RI 19.B1) TaxID=665571 RepID=E0RP33_WINT6|nr:DNA polymerase IV [Spirochaeta thermophila]ADN02695.1 predicted DNA polymerase IV [Spirochaeta thermophila DSM 6192]